MSKSPFRHEQSFMAAKLTPGEARRLVWRAGNIALLNIDAAQGVQTYVGEHFNVLLDAITTAEDEMNTIRSAGGLDEKNMRLDMGRLHYGVKRSLREQAEAQAMLEYGPFYELQEDPSLSDPLSYQSNNVAAQIVQTHLEAAYQQLARGVKL